MKSILFSHVPESCFQNIALKQIFVGYNVQQIRGFGLFTNSTPRGVNEYNEYGKQIGSTRRQERDVEETSVSGRKGRGGKSKGHRQT